MIYRINSSATKMMIARYQNLSIRLVEEGPDYDIATLVKIKMNAEGIMYFCQATHKLYIRFVCVRCKKVNVTLYLFHTIVTM